jgi:hypothetical protein
MKIARSINTWFVIALALITVNVQGAGPTEYRRLSVKEYRDKMKAGWIGQILGVSWGAPTEGRYRQIMPAADLQTFVDRFLVARDRLDQADRLLEDPALDRKVLDQIADLDERLRVAHGSAASGRGTRLPAAS